MQLTKPASARAAAVFAADPVLGGRSGGSVRCQGPIAVGGRRALVSTSTGARPSALLDCRVARRGRLRTEGRRWDDGLRESRAGPRLRHRRVAGRLGRGSGCARNCGVRCHNSKAWRADPRGRRGGACRTSFSWCWKTEHCGRLEGTLHRVSLRRKPARGTPCPVLERG